MHLPECIDQYERGIPLAEIARSQGTSTAWVSRILTKIAVHNPRKKSDIFWTAEEDRVIEDLSLTSKEAAALLPKRTASAVLNRRKDRGLSRLKSRRQWTTEDVDYIKASHLTDYALGKEFGVSGASIKAVRASRGAVKEHLCVHCGSKVGSKGNFCQEHRRLGRRTAFYRSRIVKMGGDLSSDQIRLLLVGDCTYCGTSEAMGIDRVDSSKGYTVSNTVAACGRCNTMKLDMNTPDWIAHMRKILEHYDGK